MDGHLVRRGIEPALNVAHLSKLWNQVLIGRSLGNQSHKSYSSSKKASSFDQVWFFPQAGQFRNILFRKVLDLKETVSIDIPV